MGPAHTGSEWGEEGMERQRRGAPPAMPFNLCVFTCPIGAFCGFFAQGLLVGAELKCVQIIFSWYSLRLDKYSRHAGQSLPS